MGSNFDWDAFFSGRKAKKNPRRSLTSVTRTPSALSQRGIAPSTERNIFEAGPSLQQMQVYPSGDPIRSISQAQPLEPVYQQVYTPPTRHTGGQGGSLPRGVGYSRSYSASQGAAQPSKGMKDLIDPQLWRLADGGSYPAMVELERRGPGHYRPARPNPRNPTLAHLVDGGRGLRGKDLSNMPRGLRKGVRKGILHHDQHEPLWPAPRVSKARPGYGGFLKGKTGWPAWKEDSGWNHAKVVIQFMIMGRGNPSDYPSLIRKMAKILPPNEPALSGIWAKYQRNFAKIQKKSGGRMPTLTQLKKIESKANPRRRRNTAGFVQQPQIIDVSSARPLFRWGWEEADGKMHGGYTFSDEAALQDLAKDVAQAFGIPVKDIGIESLGADGDFFYVVVFSQKTDQDLVEGQLVHFGGLEQSGLASMLSDPPVAQANPYDYPDWHTPHWYSLSEVRRFVKDEARWAWGDGHGKGGSGYHPHEKGALLALGEGVARSHGLPLSDIDFRDWDYDRLPAGTTGRAEITAEFTIFSRRTNKELGQGYIRWLPGEKAHANPRTRGSRRRRK